MHGNARSSPLGRLGMVLRVEEGEPVAQVARGMRVSRQCVSKWVRRYREEGQAPVWRTGRRGCVAPPAYQPGDGGAGFGGAADVAGGPGSFVGVDGSAGADGQPHPAPSRDTASVGMRPADRRAAQNPIRTGGSV